MFADNAQQHPNYGTTLLRSPNLYEWEIVAEDIKDAKGGDLEVVETPDGLVGFTEISNGKAAIGLWDVHGPL